MSFRFPTTLAILLTLGSSISLSSMAYAYSDDGVAIVDPAKAGPIFAIQGEYEGQIGGQNWGAQVIALSDKEVATIGYAGGLPGAGWKRGGETQEGKGKMEGDIAVVHGDHWSAEIGNGELTVLSSNGEVMGKLKRIQRESQTLGAKPPKDAIVLFDGTNVDQFDNAKLDGTYLAASNCTSKEKLGDHQLHLEFRTPFMPSARGQGRGNSGCYIQGRYECQILDSFGLEGKDNECGGIYSIQQPRVNMCFPPLSWQTYDLDFKAAKFDASGKKTQSARVTIRHNGVVIHEDLELTHGTPGHHEEGPGPDHLYLQDHGNPVVFRNIWVVKK